VDITPTYGDYVCRKCGSTSSVRHHRKLCSGDPVAQAKRVAGGNQNALRRLTNCNTGMQAYAQAAVSIGTPEHTGLRTRRRSSNRMRIEILVGDWVTLAGTYGLKVRVTAPETYRFTT